MKRLVTSEYSWFVFSYLVLLVAIFATSTYNRVLFHSLAEIFSSFIAFTIFTLTWNTRKQIENEYVLYLGVPFLFVGMFNVLHTLSFEGASVFGAGTGNLSTQLVLLSDLFEGSAFVVAALLSGGGLARVTGVDLDRRQKLGLTVGAYTLVTLGAFWLLWGTGTFPDAYTESGGLTPFKIAGQYLAAGLVVVGLVGFYTTDSGTPRRVSLLLFAAMALILASNVLFALYSTFHGQVMVFGLFLTVIAYSLLYLTIVRTGIVAPQDLLYTKLQNSKEREELLGSILRHDILNKLHVMFAYQEKIRSELPEEMQEDLDRAINATQESEELIKKIQTLASLETIDTSQIHSLDAILREAIQNHETLAAEHDIDIEYRPVEADIRGTELLEEAFANIIQNSILHSEGTRVLVHGDTSGSTVSVRIEDDGVGIPDEMRQAILDENSRQRKTDVGLLLVKEIVTMCDGEISVGSSSLGGTKIEVSFPKA